MSDSSVEWIELVVDLVVLEEEFGADCDRTEEDEPFDVDAGMLAEPLGADRFRIVGPHSLSFFGPYGPMFNLGDVIATRRMQDGTYRYVRTVEAGQVWSWVIRCPQVVDRALRITHADPSGEPRLLHQILKEGECGRILRELEEEMGGGWEYMVGNVSVQVPRKLEESEPPSAALDLVLRLQELLVAEPVE